MVNFRMWVKALTTIPKVTGKEWQELDLVSRWLIMTRSGVTTVTIFSCAVAGLLAWTEGHFRFIPWLIVTLGLFIAHGTNNILNDLTDYSRGVDTDNYFRSMYGPHPLVHGFHDKKTQIIYFVASGMIAVLAGIYALFYTGFDPVVIAFIASGAFFLLLYTFPLKTIALGELSIFLVWGPIMITGVYYVLTQDWDWHVVLASVPVGLSVMSINLGKHIDKLAEDRRKRVFTLPTVIGEAASRYLDIISLVAAYGVVLYLVFVLRYLSPVMVIVFLAGKWLFYSLAVLTKPKPEQPPDGYPAWPVWFAGFTFLHNRWFISLFMLGLLLNLLLRIYFPEFWISV